MADVFFGGVAWDNANAASYTFTNMAAGAAAANRVVFAEIAYRGNSSAVTTACMIGGVAATLVAGARQAGNNTVLELWAAIVPTGTTATVAITMTIGQARCTCATYYTYRDDLTPHLVVKPSPTVDIAWPVTFSSIPAGGFALVFLHQGQNKSWTWTNASEDYDVPASELETFSNVSGAHLNTATELTDYTVTATQNSGGATGGFIMGVAFGPAAGGSEAFDGTGSAAAAAVTRATGVKGGRGAASAAVTGQGLATGPKAASGTGAARAQADASATGARAAHGAAIAAVEGSTSGTGQKAGQGSAYAVALSEAAGEGSASRRGNAAASAIGAPGATGRTHRAGSGQAAAIGLATATGTKPGASRGQTSAIASASATGRKSAAGIAEASDIGAASVTGRKSAEGQGSASVIASAQGSGTAQEIIARSGSGTARVVASVSATGRKSAGSFASVRASAVATGAGRKAGAGQGAASARARLTATGARHSAGAGQASAIGHASAQGRSSFDTFGRIIMTARLSRTITATGRQSLTQGASGTAQFTVPISGRINRRA